MLGRKSAPGAPSGSVSDKPETVTGLPAVETANKKFLLGKLLQGIFICLRFQNICSDANEEPGSELPDFEERKEADVVSEAGTFVVDVSKRQSAGHALHMQRVVENSDDSTDSDTDSK